MNFICFNKGNTTIRQDKIIRLEKIDMSLRKDYENIFFILVEERIDGERQWKLTKDEYDRIVKILDIVNAY